MEPAVDCDNDFWPGELSHLRVDSHYGYQTVCMECA